MKIDDDYYHCKKNDDDYTIKKRTNPFFHDYCIRTPGWLKKKDEIKEREMRMRNFNQHQIIYQ